MQKCQGLTEAMVQLHLPQRIGFQELRPCAVWIFPSSKKDACCVSFCPSSGELIAAGINFESGCKLEGSTVRKTEACVGRSRWYFLQWDASSVCRQRAEWSPPPIQCCFRSTQGGLWLLWEPVPSKASSPGASVACSYLSHWPGIQRSHQEPRISCTY